MLSMTGFATASAAAGDLAAQVRIAAVNHRGLQIQVRGDLRDPLLEEELRRLVRDALGRGSITVHATIDAGVDHGIDLERLAGAWREMADLAVRLGAPPPTLEQVAALLPRRAVGDAAAASTALADALRRATGAAIAALIAEREREGAALAAAFRGQAATLRRLVAEMGAVAAGRVAAHRDQLRARLAEVLRDQAAVTPEHLVRELAIHAERIDITEESVRLASHLDALDGSIGEGGGSGRKLEFLLQELGREINTVGAKSSDAALTALVIDAKLALDQMREQSANVL